MSYKPSPDELEKAALVLCRSIYEINSGNDLPNSQDKLFSSCKELWPLNACIDKFNGSNAYAIGYLDAAKLLGRIVIYSERKMDTLVYPIVYLYRHFLEIKLKDFIRTSIIIVGSSLDEKAKKALNGHNLMNLWNLFNPFFKKLLGHKNEFENIRKGIESYINQLHEVDPGSFSFRYDRSKSSDTHNLNNVSHINIFRFCQNMEKLTDFIECIDFEFEAILDQF